MKGSVEGCITRRAVVAVAVVLSRKFSKITYFCRLKSTREGPGLSSLAGTSPAVQPLPAQKVAVHERVGGRLYNSKGGGRCGSCPVAKILENYLLLSTQVHERRSGPFVNGCTLSGITAAACPETCWVPNGPWLRRQLEQWCCRGIVLWCCRGEIYLPKSTQVDGQGSGPFVNGCTISSSTAAGEEDGSE
jgi:hypothetical protein